MCPSQQETAGQNWPLNMSMPRGRDTSSFLEKRTLSGLQHFLWDTLVPVFGVGLRNFRAFLLRAVMMDTLPPLRQNRDGARLFALPVRPAKRRFHRQFPSR